MIIPSGKTRYLMIQGTGSHVGKSVITAALCRIFSNKGIRVAPFKAQNMALNSAVTVDGREVGRSTALQAAAARTALRVEMNPVLVKPKDEKTAQVILNGKPYGDFTARESFHRNKALRDLKWDLIRDSLDRLSKDFELIVIEGAGSPAEVNLREFDVVNMDVALHTGAPVILVGDIEPGGVIASLVGTHQLLPERERERVKGFIVNKFRGDKALLDPALSLIQEKTGWQPFGVIPSYPAIGLDEEDRLPGYSFGSLHAEVDIVIVRHRHLSNFTDFSPFALEPGVRCRYVFSPSEMGEPDCIILPGSKNTVSDIRDHHQTGLETFLKASVKQGKVVLGICAGYQMLGMTLHDPGGFESNPGRTDGFGMLNVETRFTGKKVTRRTELIPLFPPLRDRTEGHPLTGYEIHSGRVRPLKPLPAPFFRAADTGEGEGAVSSDGNIFGTSVHGIFDNDHFRRNFVDFLRRNKNRPPIHTPLVSHSRIKDDRIEAWSSHFSRHVQIPYLEEGPGPSE